MTVICLDKLTKHYSATVALEDIDLSIQDAELFFLLGPSGCGKSTLLRLIAGLQPPSSGRILFDGRDVTTVPTQRRNAVLCFQGYALWPHMTVREHIRFGLSVRKMPAAQQEQRIEEMLALIRMEGERSLRKPNQLSGGQQQRVALARALAVAPSCLLLDEPLSNLDVNLRYEMRREIRRICKEMGITTVYVTHDQKEALGMADRIAVLQDGRLVQVGTPAELYHSPATAFVADFIGRTNLLEGEILTTAEGSVRIATGAGPIMAAKGPASGRVTVSIRPERIRMVRRDDARNIEARPPDLNTVTATVLESHFLGESSEHVVSAGQIQLRVIAAPPRLDLTGAVTLEFPAADVVVLAR